MKLRIPEIVGFTLGCVIAAMVFVFVFTFGIISLSLSLIVIYTGDFIEYCKSLKTK